MRRRTQAELSCEPEASREVVKRYEVRWAHLDPTRGAEMARTRPVVIVSLDVINVRLQTETVCPLTSQLHPTWRTRVEVRVATPRRDRRRSDSHH